MRWLRTLAGLVFALVGAVSLVAAAGAWSALAHRGPDNQFTAEVAPLHSNGYAIVVPNLADQASRYGLGDLLGSGPVEITVGSSSQPVVLGLAPANDVADFLTGAKRTLVTAIGYANGEQPVSVTELTGPANPGLATAQPFWSSLSTHSVRWDPADLPSAALVIMRTDGQANVDARITVARDGGWLPTAAWALLIGGLAGLFGGVGLLFWPSRKTEMVLVLEAHRMVDFADRVAERLAGTRPRRTRTAIMRREHDLTGELVPVRTVPDEAVASPDSQTTTEVAPAPRRNWRDVIEADKRRSDVVRHNQRRPSGPRTNQRHIHDDLAELNYDGETATAQAAGEETGRHRLRDLDEPTGESPYIHTAT